MEKIYYGGDILTMDENCKEAEAVWVKDKRICGLGSFSKLIADAPNAKLVDLKGCCLMPSFIDSHSHITAFAATLNLISLSECNSREEVVSKLKREKQGMKPEEWIIGFGYDHNRFPDLMHPDKSDLDQVSVKQPVLITHASGHMGAVNEKGLALLNITPQTPDPKGGKIGRLEDKTTPNGYLEENAFLSVQAVLPSKSRRDLLLQLQTAQDIYLSYGITTAQDGKSTEAEISLLAQAQKEGNLKIDIVSFVDIRHGRNLISEYGQYCKGYRSHYRIGGYKMFLDGSPQGRTAWLSEPYEKASDGYRGYPALSDQEVEACIDLAESENRQILAHCNGDAAAAQYISAYGRRRGKKDLRPVIIHAQLLRKDQLSLVKEYQMIPSFFVAHIFYWGDTHIRNLGRKRALEISPLASCVKQNIPFTIHQDTPVIRPDMFMSIWCAVNRISRDGVSFSPEERISPYEAIKAVTVNAAYQYHEEKEKGSIQVGKLADLIIVSENPLTCKADKLKEIEVLETIKEGRTLFLKNHL